MKGILLKPDMIQVIIEGRKTQTRRVIKPQPRWQEPNHELEWRGRIVTLDSLIHCAPYRVGETVYIKEAYCHKVNPITAEVSYDEFWYCLTNPEVIKVDGDGGQEFTKAGYEASPWLSPLFMPERAARYFIKIKDVRAERLQEITEEDALKEGIRIIAGTHQSTAKNPETDELKLVGQPEPFTARYHYEPLWDCINPDYPWESNPWVFRYEFEYQAKENV